MKRNPLYILLCLFVSLTFIVACNNDDFSTNSSLKLAFSNDTLRLDTILTGIGTSTRQLKVYNRNKESLVISSITLADGSNSGFRINVDGMKGSNFSNIEIRGKDSLFIFIEATIRPANSDIPFSKKTPSFF